MFKSFEEMQTDMHMQTDHVKQSRSQARRSESGSSCPLPPPPRLCGAKDTMVSLPPLSGHSPPQVRP